jgi:hypothetical protein
MGLAQRMVDWFVTDKVAHLAERVAGRSRLATYQRVCDRLPTLDVHEARGYIRARAAAIVIQEADKLIAQEGAAVQKLRTRLVSAALDSLVTAILQQAEQTRRASRPHVRRMAA